MFEACDALHNTWYIYRIEISCVKNVFGIFIFLSFFFKQILENYNVSMI